MHSWVQCLKTAGVRADLWEHLKELRAEALKGMYLSKTWEETLQWKGQVQMIMNLSLSLADELEMTEDEKFALVRKIEGDTPLILEATTSQTSKEKQ